MNLHPETDFEKLLFEKLHVKSLKKIIEIKDKQIKSLAKELKLVVVLDEEEIIEQDISKKDRSRVQKIQELEKKVKYVKKRYEQLLNGLKTNNLL